MSPKSSQSLIIIHNHEPSISESIGISSDPPNKMIWTQTHLHVLWWITFQLTKKHEAVMEQMVPPHVQENFQDYSYKQKQMIHRTGTNVVNPPPERPQMALEPPEMLFNKPHKRVQRTPSVTARTSLKTTRFTWEFLHWAAEPLKQYQNSVVIS